MSSGSKTDHTHSQRGLRLASLNCLGLFIKAPTDRARHRALSEVSGSYGYPELLETPRKQQSWPEQGRESIKNLTLWKAWVFSRYKQPMLAKRSLTTCCTLVDIFTLAGLGLPMWYFRCDSVVSQGVPVRPVGRGSTLR